MSKFQTFFYRALIAALVCLLFAHHTFDLSDVPSGPAPDTPGEERPGVVKRILKRFAHWSIEEMFRGKKPPREPKRNILAIIPADSPDSMVREMGVDGAPTIDHSSGW